MIKAKEAKESTKEKITKLIDISKEDLKTIGEMAEEQERSIKKQIEIMIKQQCKTYRRFNNLSQACNSEDIQEKIKIAQTPWIK